MLDERLAPPGAHSARDWVELLNAYRSPSAMRSSLELSVTIVPLIALWALAWMALTVSFWLTLVLAVPAAGFLVRLFMIQHDCSHGAFFRRRAMNDWVGRAIGVLTLTPYDVWRRSHAVHHATTGNLDRRGIGDIYTLTVEEYSASGWRDRLLYRLYRNPLVLFGLGPGFVFLLQNRLPLGFMRDGWVYWFSTMATNLGIALFVIAMMYCFGVASFLAVHLPIVLLASTIGVWLFYIQHQFEETHWERQVNWNVHDAALHGSSHYDLPCVLRWFTANIGVHHVHHLCSRIPYYRLPDVLKDYPELTNVKRVTLSDSFRFTRLHLWDDRKKRLVSFKEFQNT
ncbi:MAG: fatty acid desaturase [Hyphomicrobiaceae bacterium]